MWKAYLQCSLSDQLNYLSLVHSNSHPHARQISNQDLITQYEGSKDRRHIALWPISLQTANLWRGLIRFPEEYKL